MSTASPIPDTHVDLLDAKGFANLTSLGPDGAPHSQVVWYAPDGDVLQVSTLKGRQKARNVARDPRVSVTILDPGNPYRYVELRGRVVEVRDDPDSAFVNGLTKKYMGVDEYPTPARATSGSSCGSPSRRSTRWADAPARTSRTGLGRDVRPPPGATGH